MFRNLVTSLLDHELIETTDAKAKELRRVADRMITLGKRGTCTRGGGRSRSSASATSSTKLFDELAARYRRGRAATRAC